MLCSQCGSPEHLIRDFLTAKRAALVSIVLDGSLEIVEIPTDLSINEMSDVYQNHPDDMWIAISEKIENTEENTDLNTSVSPMMYNKLKQVSNQREYFKDTNTQSPKLIVNLKSQKPTPFMFNSTSHYLHIY